MACSASVGSAFVPYQKTSIRDRVGLPRLRKALAKIGRVDLALIVVLIAAPKLLRHTYCPVSK
jgi:hypothetical protein